MWSIVPSWILRIRFRRRRMSRAVSVAIGVLLWWDGRSASVEDVVEGAFS